MHITLTSTLAVGLFRVLLIYSGLRFVLELPEILSGSHTLAHNLDCTGAVAFLGSLAALLLTRIYELSAMPAVAIDIVRRCPMPLAAGSALAFALSAAQLGHFDTFWRW